MSSYYAPVFAAAAIPSKHCQAPHRSWRRSLARKPSRESGQNSLRRRVAEKFPLPMGSSQAKSWPSAWESVRQQSTRAAIKAFCRRSKWGAVSFSNGKNAKRLGRKDPTHGAKVMGDVKAINSKSISPRVILATLAEEIDELEEIFVVAFPKKTGNRLYCSGSLGNVALAALLLQDFALSTRGDTP